MLVFIIIVREVEMALLLYTPRASVMSVMAWEFLGGGNFTGDTAIALLQTAVILAIWFLARKVFRVELHRM